MTHLMIGRQRDNIMDWFCEHHYKSSSCKHYLYISSEDSRDVFPKNTMTDFVVELPDTVHLDDGPWEMALMDVSYDKNIHTNRATIYLLCDVCEYSRVHYSSQPILRKLMRHSSYRILQHFVDIKTSEIKRMHFRMVDAQLQPIVHTGLFDCTLLLQRKKDT